MLATTEVDDDIKSSEDNPPSTNIQSEMIIEASNNRQHISRLSQFQRNTVHLCDQIHEHA